MRNFAYVLLLSIYPVLAMYSYNTSEALPTDMIMPGVLALILGCGIYGFTYLLTRESSRAALITTVLLAAFFSYGHIRAHTFAAWPALLAISIVPTTLIVLILRVKKLPNFLPKYMFRLTLILIVVSTGVSVISLITQPNEASALSPIIRQEQENPSIYYIILDTYAGKKTLQDIFNYDNSPFLEDLQDRDFQVLDNAKSNYAHTHSSMASTLNMRRVTIEEEERSSTLLSMIANNKVVADLRSNGYTTYFISGGWVIKNANKHFDVYNVFQSTSPLKKTALAGALIQTSFLHAVTSVTGNFFTTYGKQTRLYAFSEVAKISQNTQPLFAYVHIMAPHPPYVFGGTYISQLSYINDRLLEAVDTILQTSEKPPIIIIQGDHGPWWVDNHHYDILNAFYLPDGFEMPRDLTPINTFRVIFNHYFKTDYQLLPNTSY